jgi:hypothetical protein
MVFLKDRLITLRPKLTSGMSNTLGRDEAIFKLIQKDANLTKDQATYEIMTSHRELASNKIVNNQYRR